MKNLRGFLAEAQSREDAEKKRQAKDNPDDQKNLESWLKEGSNGTMRWMEKRKDERGSLFNYFPEAKSVVSVGLNYYSGKDQTSLNADYKFSNYAYVNLDIFLNNLWNYLL